MPTSQIDVTGLETLITRIGAGVGALGDKVRALFVTIKELRADVATIPAAQAKLDALLAAATPIADAADAIQALSEDIVNPDTPPVDPGVPIPDVPPVTPEGRRR